MFSEYPVQRLGFGDIICLGCSAVRVHIVHFIGLDAGIVQRGVHGFCNAVDIRPGNVPGIRGHAVACEFGIHARAALPGACGPVIRICRQQARLFLCSRASFLPVGSSKARAAKSRVKIVRPLIKELVQEYEQRGLQIHEVNGGYQFRSSPLSAEYVRINAEYTT